jgi:hypothetical protein
MFKFEDLSRWFEPFLRNVWSAAVGLFERHPARIGASAVFLFAAVITGKLYVDRTRQYQEIVSTTIRAEGEGAPQRFRVLEAFLMAAVDAKLSKRVGDAIISDEFSRRLEGMHKVLSEPAPLAKFAGGIAPPNQERGVRISIPDYIPEDLNYVESPMSLRLQNAVVTDNEDIGILFFPANLLRTRLESDYWRIFHESRKKGYSRTLAAAVAKDPIIADDIAISGKLLPVMQSFTSVSLFKEDEGLEQLRAELRPAQVYYITKNGVNRTVNNTDAREQQVVYRNIFRPTTFFPSRPYYVEAFKNFTPATLAGITGPAKNSFYVSQPYLDIGGFGVVITLARPISYKSHSEGAICFDLLVNHENYVAFRLKERLMSFGATPQEVACRIGFRGEISCGPSGVDIDLKNTLRKHIERSMKTGDLSTVVSNISILDDRPKREDIAQTSFLDFFKYPVEIIFGHNTRPITFAIPLTAPRAPSGKNELEAQFMITSLNLERFQQITSLLGLVSVSSLALAFFVVFLSWRGEMRTLRSYEEAFKTVDGLLYGAPTPYCRLSARDTVVDCNTAFCGMLKMPADGESVKLIKGRTFESLVAPRSKTIYHDVQQRRRAGEEVAPYTLYFTRVGDSDVEAQVTSGVIPGRTPRELPETFGIVIPAPNFPP